MTLAYQVDNLTKANKKLSLLMETLKKLSEEQLELKNEDDWAELLDQKQQILDALAVIDPPGLVAETLLLIDKLRYDQQIGKADDLSEALNEIGERIEEIVHLEKQAQKLLSDRMAALRQNMSHISKCKKAKILYHQPVADTSPRFLNGTL